MPRLAQHQHGKSAVRVARVWRHPDGTHAFAEWTVDTVLESAMAHAFETPSNAGMTATDTQKNAVYHIAKRCTAVAPPEEFALALARHFLASHPLVATAKVSVRAAPWARATVSGAPHRHGFADAGGGTRTARVVARRGGAVDVVAGVDGWRVLKTTRSGYEGFHRDALTLLPETRERVAATAMTASWRYEGPVAYDQTYKVIKSALAAAFFGPPTVGVHSPSLQFTLHAMAQAALEAAPAVDSIHIRMPNLHFLPCAPPGSTFDDDVYVATSEPHGTIEATVVREGKEGHVSLWGGGDPAAVVARARL